MSKTKTTPKQINTPPTAHSNLWVFPRLRHLAQCWLANQRMSLFCMSRLGTPRAGSGPKNPRPEPPLTSSSAISFPRNPACPETQYSPTAYRVEIYFNAFWHYWTKGDVVS